MRLWHHPKANSACTFSGSNSATLLSGTMASTKRFSDSQGLALQKQGPHIGARPGRTGMGGARYLPGRDVQATEQLEGLLGQAKVQVAFGLLLKLHATNSIFFAHDNSTWRHAGPHRHKIHCRD